MLKTLTLCAASIMVYLSLSDESPFAYGACGNALFPVEDLDVHNHSQNCNHVIPNAVTATQLVQNGELSCGIRVQGSVTITSAYCCVEKYSYCTSWRCEAFGNRICGEVTNAPFVWDRTCTKESDQPEVKGVPDAACGCTYPWPIHADAHEICEGA